MSINADQFKIGAGYVLGSVAVFLCLYAAATAGDRSIDQILICTLGAVLGWIAGIVITPFNESEKKQFSDLSKTITTLVSGFVLGKIEAILNSSFVSSVIDGQYFSLRALLFSICFFVGVLFTFIGRKYFNGSEEERRVKRDKILSGVAESLKELERLN